MTAQLIGQRQKEIVYDRRVGQFRQNGRFVSRVDVLQVVDRDVQRTTVQLQGLTRLLSSGKITLPDWQERMADTLKQSHLRMAMMGAGGKAQMTQQQYGYVGARLYKEYQAIDQFAQDLAASKLTEKQALARTALYARTTALSFHQAEKVTKIRDGFEGRRDLDALAQHCLPCIGHSTNGLFVPAAEIVPTGTDCLCHGYCRCRITWRRTRSLNFDPSRLLSA